jgi:DNA-directed RNA polymerase specialized sigma24 family protein
MPDLSKIETQDLIACSQAEYVVYIMKRPTDSLCCYELFRRAANGDDQEAWEAIYLQYQREVACWVDGPPDSVEDRVVMIFTKFWAEGKRSVFVEKFKDFGMVMGYLKQIAIHVRIDLNRKSKPPGGSLVPLEKVPESVPDLRLKPVSGQAEMNELYQKSLQLLTDEKETLIWKLTLVGFKPQEIASQYADRFENVDEVNRIKERFLLRLRSKI